jgi:AbrB family looped-hinge helix DNA binding protein
MRISSQGQVTIPPEIRERLGMLPDTEVEFEVDGDAVRIVRAPASREGRGASLITKLRGKAKGGMSTDEIMALVRGEA